MKENKQSLQVLLGCCAYGLQTAEYHSNLKKLKSAAYKAKAPTTMPREQARRIKQLAARNRKVK